ncbi:TonB-dependent siderophore receptor [Sodalis sp. RH16]|uniref:TonB-dependent siderophore receptor n=1 Tax=Sodalis sp. RH16 TaxID=3394331 RepID=UPI0039B52AD3
MQSKQKNGWKKGTSISRLALSISMAPAFIAGTSVYSSALYAADEVPVNFSIPSGSLESSLINIARQSNQTIAFDPGLVAPYQAKAIRGKFSTRAIILKQLQGTSLTVSSTANGTLTIRKLSAAYPVQDTAKSLPAITVNGTADQSEDATTYNPSTSSSATRTTLSLQDTAQSVNVVSRKVLDDRQATSLEDALKNVAGVNIQDANRGVNTIYIRGFAVTSGSTDGVANTNTTALGTATGNANIDGIERIEVLKGPQAVLAGSSSPAGSINVVRKAPTADPIHTYKVEVSKYGELKNAIDLGGPLNDDKSFRYRLNASTMRSDNAFPDFNGNHSDYIAPVLSWQNDKTYLKVGAEFNSYRNSGPAATYYSNGTIHHLPEYRMGDKDDHFSGNDKTVYYEFKQDLSDNWSFNSKATYNNDTSVVKINENYGVSDNGDYTAHALSNRIKVNSYSLQNDIRGKFTTGSAVTHNILLGYDYQHSVSTSWDTSSFDIYTNGNVFNPGSMSYPAIPDADLKSYTMLQIQKGVVLQDQIDVFKKLHFQISAKRAEYANSTSVFYDTSTSYAKYTASKWIPNYGVSYDITPDITAYVNLLRTFEGAESINPTTHQPIPPSAGKSTEAGLKFNFLDDNLTLTTDLFQLEQTNVAIYNSAGQPVGIQDQKSKGWDIELNGQILPGWNITSSYTYAIAQSPTSASSESTSSDTRQTGQPKHSGSIWTSYEIQSGQLKGLGSGIGVQAASNTWNGSSGEYFKMGGWAQTDMAIFYHQPKYTLTLGVNNVFDRTLFSYSSTADYIGVKPGRVARLTATYSF